MAATPDEGTAYVIATVRAENSREAELRMLAVIDYDFEDDLRGATTEALRQLDPMVGGSDLWTVRLNLARPRG